MRLIKVKQLKVTQRACQGSSPGCLFWRLTVPTTLGRGMGVDQGRWGQEHSRERKSQAQGLGVLIAGGR